MTETGHGSNVQALGTTATYDAGDAGVRHPHARRRRAQGLHRQRGARTADMAVVFAQLERRRRAARRARVRRAAARRRRRGAARRPDRGLRRQDGPQRRRQRPDLVRRRAGAARQPARPFADGHARRRLLRAPIENPNQRFFTMLGTLVQGRVCVGGAGDQRRKVALTIAVRLRASRRRQFGPPGRPRRRCCSTTACTSAGCCRCWPGRTRCTSRRSGVVARAARGLLRRRPSDERERRELETLAAGAEGARAPGTRPRRSRSAARRAAARATCAPTGSPRSRPTPTSSRPSRATTTCCSSWSPRTC